jgi:hypothetical protein
MKYTKEKKSAIFIPQAVVVVFSFLNIKSF